MSTIKLKTKLVKKHFALALKQEQKNLVDYVLCELKEINVENMQMDPAFLRFISELIENQIKKRNTSADMAKPSKMDILVEILKRVFPHISEKELDACKISVEFLLKHKLVTKVPLSKVMMFYLKKKFTLE